MSLPRNPQPAAPFLTGKRLIVVALLPPAPDLHRPTKVGSPARSRLRASAMPWKHLAGERRGTGLDRLFQGTHMTLDKLEVHSDPASYVRWPGGGGYQPVELRINGTGLISWVREIELPYAEAEHDQRALSGESPEELGERGGLAGSYLYPSSAEIFLPSRNLLGEPYPHGFATDPHDPRNRKSLLLSCACGITDCWFLLATITVHPDTIQWSDFCQFHRDWKYDLGPFVFDRQQYEAQLTRPGSGPRMD